jgi:soluble lytic murein transglycosylase-like protein
MPSSPANVSLPALITQEAQAQGVPPSIALAVAQQESGVSQWTQNGNLVTGSAGEIGVFQLMPATAGGLGVDPTDVNQNIQGGITFLAQLFAKYGNWAQALSAYNSGSPTGSPSYANSVLAIASSMAPLPDASAPSLDLTDVSGDSADGSSISVPLVIGLGLGAVALAWWVLD